MPVFLFLRLKNIIFNKKGTKLIFAPFNWHPLRESNSQLTLRRGLLYPFNYGGIKFLS